MIGKIQRERQTMKTDYIFQFDSTDHGTVDWQFHKKVADKMHHAVWMVKKSDLVVLTKLPAADAAFVHQELFESFDSENQSVRDHNNKKARERRARNKK